MSDLTNTLQPIPKSTFTLWSPREVMRHEIPKDTVILDDGGESGFLMKGQITAVIGPGGVGKSRLMMQLAIAQITGKEWGGLNTRGLPLKWLLIGNENSIQRQQRDLGRMMSELTEEQIDLVDCHLVLQVSFADQDGFINLGDQNTKDHYQEAIERVKPDVLVIDPFANVLDGDMNDGADVRKCIRDLRGLLGVGPALLIVHHSKTGAEAYKKAIDWDRSDFGKGSKDLYSLCRAVINIVPAEANGGDKVIMACGKSNDCRPFKVRGLLLNSDTMRYGVDLTFDLNAWKADVNGERSDKVCSMAVVLRCIAEGSATRKAILEKLKDELGVSPATIDRQIKAAKDVAYLTTSKRGGFELTDAGRTALNTPTKTSFEGIDAA